MATMVRTDNIVRAFGEDHVVRLTGLSRGQLRAWDRSGFFVCFIWIGKATNPKSKI